MVYKKYIRRNGKLYGPYIYESKRVDGKVISEYHGSEESKPVKGVKIYNYKKIFLFSIATFIFLVLLFFIISFNPSKNKLTGGVILNVETSYEKGEPLGGVLKFLVDEGELMPENSQVIFENLGNTYGFALKDVLDETPSEGDYYFENKKLQGSGLGYGLQGEKEVYPEVGFVLLIYNTLEDSEENVEVINSEENSQEENTTEEIPSGEIIESNSQETENPPNEDNPAPITGNFLNSIFGITGMVSMELKEEIEGKTSKGNPFVYNLKKGETAELKPMSVNIGGEEIKDNTVSLKIEEGKAIVETDYSEKRIGYGEDYLGNKNKEFSLDLSDMNLLLDEGELNIKIIYNDEELISVKTLLKEGEKNSQEVVEEGEKEEEIPKEDSKPVVITNEQVTSEKEMKENATVEEITESSVWDMGNFLTDEERKILDEEFPNVPLNSVKSEIYKDRIIRGYKFGEYYVEYSYDSSLNEDVLKVQMERDRIKFLKDIATSLLKEETVAEIIEGFEDNYTV